jgi:hypothetical protein
MRGGETDGKRGGSLRYAGGRDATHADAALGGSVNRDDELRATCCDDEKLKKGGAKAVVAQIYEQWAR